MTEENVKSYNSKSFKVLMTVFYSVLLFLSFIVSFFLMVLSANGGDSMSLIPLFLPAFFFAVIVLGLFDGRFFLFPFLLPFLYFLFILFAG